MNEITEDHQREQYFFDRETSALLADQLERFERPCCLCTPMVARELQRRGKDVRLLDLDERFSEIPGFLRFDLNQPKALAEDFDVILCDPPFFTVSLRRLFIAVRLLHQFQMQKRLIVGWLTRRAHALQSSFEPFALSPTGFYAGYETVERCQKNEIMFYSNFPLKTRN